MRPRFAILMIFAAALACLMFPVRAQQDDAALARAATDTAYYEAMGKLGDNADPETKRLIAVTMALERAARGGGAAHPTVQLQPQQATGRTAWDVFASIALGTVQFVKEAAQTLGPVAAQVYVARTNAHTQEVVAGFNRDTQIATVNGFTTLGSAGIAGTRDTASAGFGAATAIAAHIPQPGTTYNVSGQGVNFGAGTVSYAPISGSYNPVNPAPTTPTVVTCVGDPPVCTR